MLDNNDEPKFVDHEVSNENGPSDSSEVTNQNRLSSRPDDHWLVTAEKAAQLCGIGRTTWYKLRAAGQVPAPIRLARRVLWHVEELRDWTAAGCPALHQWRRIRDRERTNWKSKQ